MLFDQVQVELELDPIDLSDYEFHLIQNGRVPKLNTSEFEWNFQVT